jgi:hypothetical protein
MTYTHVPLYTLSDDTLKEKLKGSMKRLNEPFDDPKDRKNLEENVVLLIEELMKRSDKQ